MSSKNRVKTDDDLLLPYGDILQVKNGEIWETKFVVVSSNDKDPSRILIGFFDNESDWKEGYIGDLAFRSPETVVKEITLYSTCRPAFKDESKFRNRSRGFVLAVASAIDPDDVDTVLFNALDEDQKSYWLNMFRNCFKRLQKSKEDSEISQKEKSGWMPTLTKRSVSEAKKDPIMIQYETLQRDGRWIHDNENDDGNSSIKHSSLSLKGGFQEVPEQLRHYFFHIHYGTDKILNMRRSFLRCVRFFIHLMMFVMLICYIWSTTSLDREMAQTLRAEVDTPYYYSSDELKMIGFQNISSVSDLYGWMSETLISHGYFYETASTVTRLENLMLGSMRVRQVRRELTTSSLDSNDTGITLQAYSLKSLR